MQTKLKYGTRMVLLADSSWKLEQQFGFHSLRTAISDRVARAHLPTPLIATVVQECPVVSDGDRTLNRIGALAIQAAKTDDRLIAFTEAFVSFYPNGVDFGVL